MKFIFAIFGVSLVLLVVIHTVASIKCYNCNSFYQQDCADYFDNRTVNTVDCSVRLKVNNTYCRKIIQETFYEGEYHYRYIRQCAAIAPKQLQGKVGSFCYERSGVYKVTVRYCHCNDQEGCNSAMTESYSKLLLFLLVLYLLSPYILCS